MGGQLLSRRLARLSQAARLLTGKGSYALLWISWELVSPIQGLQFQNLPLCSGIPAWY